MSATTTTTAPKTNKQLEAEYVASLSPEAAAAYASDAMHRRASNVGRYFANRHFERRNAGGVDRPNAGAWDALHNGFYLALQKANDESDFTTSLLQGSDLNRRGATASQVVASLYSVAKAHLENQRRYNGYADQVAEYEKLLELLAPIVAAVRPGQEIAEYTAAKTAEYHASKAE